MQSAHTSVVAFDTETALIRPALLAPPLVCVTWQELGHAANIEHHSTAEPRIRAWLENPNVLIVGHNVAYDLAVIIERFPHLRSLVFKAYAAGRVTDTMIRQQLLDTADGTLGRYTDSRGQCFTHEYSLEALAKRKGGIHLLKDGWRLSYAEFIDTPMADWPKRAREVQAQARVKLAELLAQATGDPVEDIAKTIATQTTLSPSPPLEDKDLQKTIDGLVEMINGDPDRASSYPLDDARATLAVFMAQEAHVSYLADQFRQARGAWALHLSSAWGLRTDAVGVELLRAATQASYDELEDELIQLGFIRSNKKKTRDTKVAKARMIKSCVEEGLVIPRTDGHTAESTKCRDLEGKPLPGGHDDCAEHVCLDAESCAAVEDVVLHNYAEISTLKKVLTNDIRSMQNGLQYPLHTRYGFAKTGRTTSSKPNVQNQTKRKGFRECFVPRLGTVFFAADYPGGELYTWAQTCKTWLGFSKLAEALNAGIDSHTSLAAEMLECTYDEVKARRKDGDQEAEDFRQLAKIGNFGFMGGMGPKTMLVNARKQLGAEACARLKLDLKRMTDLKEAWLATWPEAKAYFDHIKAKGPPYPKRFEATVEGLFTGRVRGRTTYCATCNTPFQGLLADIAKEAMWRVSCEQYLGYVPYPEAENAARQANQADLILSPLFNTRTVAFVHDEIIGESPIARAHDAAMRLADVMVEAANIYLPDVPIKRSKIEPLLMSRWSKKAKPEFGADGRLIPWAA